MGTIIKLFVAAVILNAAVQAGLAEYKYYRFEDAVHETMLFSVFSSDAEIIKRVVALADENDVLIEPSEVTVTHQRNDLKVSMSYTEDVALIPGLYTKAWTFNPTASVRLLVPPRQ